MFCHSLLLGQFVLIGLLSFEVELASPSRHRSISSRDIPPSLPFRSSSCSLIGLNLSLRAFIWSLLKGIILSSGVDVMWSIDWLLLALVGSVCSLSNPNSLSKCCLVTPFFIALVALTVRVYVTYIGHDQISLSFL